MNAQEPESSHQAGAAGSSRRPSWPARRPAQAALAYGLAYLLFGPAAAAIAAAIGSPLAAAAWVTLAGAAALALSLLFVVSICRIGLRPRAEVGWMLAGLLFFLLTRPRLFIIIGRWFGSAAAGKTLATLLPVLPGQELLGNIALILWAAFLGRIVSHLLREGKLILPVAVVASIVDIFTVFWGVVARVSEKAPEMVDAFSASAPVAPPEGVVAPILTSVGIGDFLFIAVFLSLALRTSMNVPKTTWAVFAVMLVAPLAFILWPSAPGMPGLPFISLAVLAVNWRHLSFTRDEKRALAFAGALVCAVVLTVWVILRH